MTSAPTFLDGLLDDDQPVTTTNPLAPAEPETNDEPMPVAPANPDGEMPPTATPEPPTTPVVAGEKLVIVEGQRFLVDAAVDNETVRQHLIRQGFAGLAGAEIRTGTTKQDGRTLPTVDFIKKAGTKG